ncbi:MAG: hypothetical protein O3A47_10395, partial [Chloroflexi bacterium]|nr:hypothetical protein [Chloroflexota bacterium]
LALALALCAAPVLGTVLAQDEPVVDPLVARATAWVEAKDERIFEVLEDDRVVARVEVRTAVREQGEARFLEVTLARHRPPPAGDDPPLPEREVAWLRPDETLSPYQIRWIVAGELGKQNARLGVDEGKLTGSVLDRGVVRNVPGAVCNEGARLLRAALLPREDGARLHFTGLTFDRRGLRLEVDESLVFVGFEEPEGGPKVAVIEHRSERGRRTGTYRFDESGALMSYILAGTPVVTWRPYVEPDED